jgi:hypothetical protein
MMHKIFSIIIVYVLRVLYVSCVISEFWKIPQNNIFDLFKF